MDMEKLETEFEFYNFTLESLKKECKCFNVHEPYKLKTIYTLANNFDVAFFFHLMC